MSESIDFYFDFSSPYGYLASERIEHLAEQCAHRVRWRPILLGAVFKKTGERPLASIPLVDAYTPYDLARCSREHAIDYQHPTRFPLATVAACRGYYWIQAQHPDHDSAYVHSVLRAYFCDGLAIDDAAVLADLVQSLGVPSDEFLTGIQSNAVRTDTRRATDEAIERGVFGSPMMYVGDQCFFGNDRLEQLSHWLTSGGW